LQPATTETGIILLASRVEPDHAALRAAIARDFDWTRLSEIALHHGTAGLLCDRVLQAAADTIPADLRTAMRSYLESCERRYLLATAELIDLLDTLASAGIGALPFKGPALAGSIYKRPALRPFLDLDLLIRESEIDATFAILRRAGFMSQYPDLRPDHRTAYHRYNGQDCLTAEGRFLAVEPHWRLAPRTLGVDLDTAPLFERAAAVTIGGRQVRTLSHEDALLVACLQGSKDEWTRLIQIADVARLLARDPPPEPAAVLARATQAGIRRMLLTGIALATSLLGAHCHPDFARALEADRIASFLASFAGERLWRRRHASSVFTLSAFRWQVRERWRDRARYAAGTLFTARVPHFQTVSLPPSLRSLYPLVRLGRDFVALPLWRLLRPRRSA
jgi:hypothetical protein